MIWKDITGYEDYYQISDSGIVRRKKVTVQITRSGITYTHTHPDKILKGSINKDGYRRVELSVVDTGKRVCVFVHRLVASHFLINSLNKKEVNHIDGNKVNNHVSNLEWVSPKENVAHAFANKLNKNQGANHTSAVLKAESIPDIRYLLSQNIPVAQIAKYYGVSTGAIYPIKNKTGWKSVV